MSAHGQQIKKADLAGKWYSASASQLKDELASYLSQAPAPKIRGRILGLVSPHAGYAYSGPVAASAFKAVEGLEDRTVFVVGFTHRKSFDGIAVFGGSGVSTPLGTLAVDTAAGLALTRLDPKIRVLDEAFADENSVEMILPFIQQTLVRPKAVLLAIGNQSYENCQILGRALATLLKDRTDALLVASSDMSHYLPYDQAVRIDKATSELVAGMNPDQLYSGSREAGHQLLCGISAVCATMIACRTLGADRFELLDRRNSGDISGDRSAVVGYMSGAFTASGTAPAAQPDTAAYSLSADQKKRLLGIARNTIETYLRTAKAPDLTETDPMLSAVTGVFVTLHKNGELRGCIGNIVGREPLYLGVRDMAVAAAVEDPRFPPVRPGELSQIDIEISVLTPLEKITDPQKIRLGQHGVLVQSGMRSGVYLPQVATETGWSLEQFMDSLCQHKAGLPASAWRTGQCAIYVFSAFVFGEKD